MDECAEALANLKHFEQIYEDLNRDSASRANEETKAAQLEGAKQHTHPKSSRCYTKCTSSSFYTKCSSCYTTPGTP